MMALLSKCGTPVCWLAPATELNTRCGTCASTAAAMMARPWVTSAFTPASNGVVSANTPRTSRIATPRAERSSSEPATTSTPRSASRWALGSVGRRTIARAGAPFASRASATAPPCPPVAPNTRVGAAVMPLL